MTTATTSSMTSERQSQEETEDHPSSAGTTTTTTTKSILKPTSRVIGHSTPKPQPFTSVPSSSKQDPSPIYYFGYGPICHATVRHRRGIPIASVQAAVLYEHRLTFAFGGVVNVVPMRGYETYGVLLQFDSHRDWQKFQQFDGGYACQPLQVYPLKTPDHPVMAYTFIMQGVVDPSVLETTEKLPQERYLKLIAEGMRQLHIDDPDYIQDQIMSVPYVPKTKPEHYRRFPLDVAIMNRKPHGVLPKINMAKYQSLCRRAPSNVAYFVLGSKVMKVLNDQPSIPTKKTNQDTSKNPCFEWVRTKAHGQPDITLLLHKMVIDPDLEMVDSQEELTPAHYAWAEHHMYEYLQQSGGSNAESSGEESGRLITTVVYEWMMTEPGDKKPSLWSRLMNGTNRRRSTGTCQGEIVHKKGRDNTSKSAPSLPIRAEERIGDDDDDDEASAESRRQRSIDSDIAQHHISNTRRKRRIRKEDVDGTGTGAGGNVLSRNDSTKDGGESSGDETPPPPTSSIVICDSTP